MVLAHFEKEVESFPCVGRKFLLCRWKVYCAPVESFLYAGEKFLVCRWKVSCAPVESFSLKTPTGRSVGTGCCLRASDALSVAGTGES